MHNSTTSVTAHRLPGHDVSATVADTKGGKDFNKDWYLQGNKNTWRGGMALNVVSDNDLIYNKKLAFTTLTSRNPNPHPPT